MTDATSLESAPDLWRRYRRRAKEHFGQHFLVNPEILRDLVREAGVESGDAVLEIGAGCGTLTRTLVAAGADVRAVEVDREAFDFLGDVFGGIDSVDLRRADALDCEPTGLIPPDGDGSRRSVSNLPYGAATEIFFHLAEAIDAFECLVWMYQREVAARMCAEPGEEAYGRLSLMIRLYADAEVVKTLAPGAFHPQPRVHSSAVCFEPVDGTRIPEDGVRERFRDLVRSAFSARRKILPNALSSGAFDKDRCEEAIERVELDRRARPETLSFGAFRRLAEAFGEQ